MVVRKKLECLKGAPCVDGFCEATNTVYEFQGCFWHGCKKCFDSDTINSKKPNRYENPSSSYDGKK